MPQDNRGQVDADLAALTRQRDPGQSPGKSSRLDTATRMMTDADLASAANCLARLNHSFGRP
jgi:hypothetical protein